MKLTLAEQIIYKSDAEPVVLKEREIDLSTLTESTQERLSKGFRLMRFDETEIDYLYKRSLWEESLEGFIAWLKSMEVRH